MTNQQLYLAIGLPILYNTVLIGIVYSALSRQIQQLETSLNKRMDELKELWRAELRRVEEVLDARLKHPEQHR